MCGIAGIVNINGAVADRKVLEAMMSAQRHRGPDDSGYLTDRNAGLGHARLSIIDLSRDAHQPMANEDSGLHIVHNGEVYNYIELAGELKTLGHAFRSRSDTEVILHAYEEWGPGCLARFNGMWSFAILDRKRDVLFCARDRFGVKPFYYHLDKDAFVFASEIKSLLKHPDIRRAPNDRTIYSYLSSGYGYMDVSEETFFKGIRQLKAAHYAELSLKTGRFEQRRYWDLDPGRTRRVKDDRKVFDGFYGLFEDSVRLRLRSDVPVGVSLSGGLDSSSVACVAAKLLGDRKMEAFSSCFEEEREYDERPFMRPVLERTGARGNFIFTKPADLFTEIETIIWHQDEPYSTLSIFPQWYVMRLARERGVKVLLTGQGGDETLGGYHKYYFYLFADLINSFRWKDASREISGYRELKGRAQDVAAPTARIILSYAAPRFLKALAKGMTGGPRPDYLGKDFVEANANSVSTERRYASILNNDLYNALKVSPLPSLLHIDDRSSMAHSVESRSPFLDYRLVEYVFSLGPEYKIRDGVTKYVLRESLKGVLPEEVRTRRDKMGFGAPLDRWFRESLKEKVGGIMTSREFRGRVYFDRDGVERKLRAFMDGKEESQYTIWSWVNLELWMRRFIDGA